MNKKSIKVGRTLAIIFDVHDNAPIIAKVDTGAYLCAIWASNIHKVNEKLFFTLFDKSSEHYTGQELSTPDFYMTVVENSFGVSESRYVVKLCFKLHHSDIDTGKLTRFSLCDRSMKKYPILIGRDYLRGRCIVDVRMTASSCMSDDEEENKSKLDEE